ncbi:MAG: sulfatase-like hydrolase/transferase [Solirubrobacteraceae bacterium]
MISKVINSIFSKVYINALAIFFLAFCYTKGSITEVFLKHLPSFASIMILSFVVVFLLFLAWLKRKDNLEAKVFNWETILKVTVFGSFFGYVLQIINIVVYLKIRDIPIDIGFFEDEFYKTIVFLLPCLFVGELIYSITKNSFKKQLIISLFVLLVVSFTAFELLYVKKNNYPRVAKTSKDKPNVILILADDLGIGDLSYNGQKKYTTPNIDKLAKEGVDFKNAFSTAPICSPSRAGLLTGQYQQRVGFEHLIDLFTTHPYARKADFEKNGHEFAKNFYWWELEMKNRGLDPSSVTLSEFLKEDGYATAAIGKWHLGAAPRFIPKNTGFDYSLGCYNAGMFYLPPHHKDVKEVFNKDNFMERLEHQLMVYKFIENDKSFKPDKEVYSTDLFTQKGLYFIEKNKKNRFFLYLPYNAVHGPFQSPKRIYNSLSYIKNNQERVYAAMVKSLDEAVGKILSKLDSLQLTENTIIIFASDNGAPLYFKAGINKPYYGGKMSGFEGGVRVPFLIYWKNRIKPLVYEE